MTNSNSPHNQQQGQHGACCKATHDEVARAAYGLYEQHGSQNGQDVRNWLDAEAHVKSSHANATHGHQTAAKTAGHPAR